MRLQVPTDLASALAGKEWWPRTITTQKPLQKKDASKLLDKIADPRTAEAALKTCEEIDRLESDADRVMRSAMSKAPIWASGASPSMISVRVA